MAKVKIQGHASGTGILTVTAPNTSTDRTITLPDATGTLLNSDGDGSSLTGLSSFNPDAAVTINDTGADVNFRIESDDNANMFFVDGGEDRIGIGTAAPPAFVSLEHSNTTALSGDGTYSAINIHNTGGVNAISTISFSGADHYGDGCLASIYAKHTNVTENQEATDLGFHTTIGETLTQNLLLTGDRGLSQFTAKAWMNLDGTGTPSFRDSHNCSSVTDVSTGSTQINYTNAMADVNYSISVAAQDQTTRTNVHTSFEAQATGSHTIYHYEAGSLVDCQRVASIVFGD